MMTIKELGLVSNAWPFQEAAALVERLGTLLPNFPTLK